MLSLVTAAGTNAAVAHAQAPTTCDLAGATAHFELGVRIGSGLQSYASIEASSAEFEQAATILRACLDAGVDPPLRDELRLQLGEALFQSSAYDEAWASYRLVRDTAHDPVLAELAARRAVEAARASLRQADLLGSLHPPTEPPQPMGAERTVPAIPFPESVERVFEAGEAYIARSDAEPELRAQIDLANASLLYRYGAWGLARPRLVRLLEEHCVGPRASRRGRDAYQLLIDMAVALDDAHELERLPRSILERRCTFDPQRTWRASPEPTFALPAIVVDDEPEATLRDLRRVAANRHLAPSDPARVDARIALARTLEVAARPHESALAYVDIARVTADQDIAAAALARAAAMPLSRRDRQAVVRAVRAFVRAHRAADPTSDAVLRALSTQADLLRSLGREAEARAATDELLQAASLSPPLPGTPNDRRVSRARLQRAADAIARLGRSMRIAPGRQPTVARFIERIREQITAGHDGVRVIIDLLGESPTELDLRPAMLVAAAQAFETLARAIDNAELTPIPDDEARARATVSFENQLHCGPSSAFPDQLRQVLDEQLRPVECEAVTRYARALADAASLGVEDEATAVARARLDSYGRSRVEECLGSESRLALAAAGVPMRATPGVTLTLEPGSAPPALAAPE